MLKLSTKKNPWKCILKKVAVLHIWLRELQYSNQYIYGRNVSRIELENKIKLKEAKLEELF